MGGQEDVDWRVERRVERGRHVLGDAALDVTAEERVDPVHSKQVDDRGVADRAGASADGSARGRIDCCFPCKATMPRRGAPLLLLRDTRTSPAALTGRSLGRGAKALR